MAERKSSRRGLVEKGNIDLYDRPRVKNPDGSISTVRSMSFEHKGKEVLVPTTAPGRDVSGKGPLGRIMSDTEAIARHKRTGKHLGVFRSPDAATRFAHKLHKDYERGRYDRRPMRKR